jgi:cytochrome P450
MMTSRSWNGSSPRRLARRRGSRDAHAVELDFDPRHPAFRADPHRWLRVLREQDPVHFSPVLNAWIVTRHADVLEVVTRSGELSNDMFSVLVGKHAGATAPRRDQHRIGANLAMADGELHARLRRLVHAFFTPQAIARMEAELQRFVDERLDEAEARGGLDIVVDLSRPLAVEALSSRILGIPPALRRPLHGWAAAATRVGDPLLAREERKENFARLTELADYLDELIAYRRAHPGDDLVSRLAADAADGSRLSHGELLAMCMSIIGGGVDTVSMGISKGLLVLIEHREQMALLRDEPGLAARATDEVLRFCAPAVFAPRVAIQTIELGGKTIAPDDVVLYSPAAACRDPSVYEDPDRLDITRDPDRSLGMAFGHGVHYCLGAALARLQCRIAYLSVVSRFPHIELAAPREDLRYGRNLLSMSIESMPVVI